MKMTPKQIANVLTTRYDDIDKAWKARLDLEENGQDVVLQSDGLYWRVVQREKLYTVYKVAS